jgi:hypothetical protein
MFPVLAVYESMIAGISIADISLSIISGYLIIDVIKRKNIRVYKPLLYLAIYIIIQYLVLTLLYSSDYTKSLIMRMLHTLIYLIALSLFTLDYFNNNIGYKCLKAVSLFASVYIIIQGVFVFMFRIYIPGTLPFISVMRDELIDFNTNIVSSGFEIRPRSIFNEPAEYCSYVLIFLFISLFLQKKSYKDYLPEIIITAGIIISKSGTGFLCALGIWGLWFIKNFIKRIISKKTMFISMGALGLGICLFFGGSFDSVINHVFGSNGMGAGLIGRVSNYFYPFQVEGGTFLKIMVGWGMYDPQVFMTSYTAIIFYFGLIGGAFWILIYFIIFQKAKGTSRRVYWLLIILGTTANTLLGTSLMYFMPFIISQIEEYPNSKFIKRNNYF